MAAALRAALAGQVAGDAKDETVVQVPPPPPPPPPLPSLAPDDRSVVGTGAAGTGSARTMDAGPLVAVEAALRREIGPVSRVLVRRAAADASTTQALVAALAGEIADATARRRFEAEARRALGAAAGGPDPGSVVGPAPRPAEAATSGSSATWRVDPAEVEAAQRALTLHVGPVARVLARRAAAEAGSADDLWRLLAAALPDAAERERFQARRRR
jgi:serine/threonine-protein kinase